ncbi:MAG: helix-turn-helix domain-containing protein [Dokdonella sp.]
MNGSGSSRAGDAHDATLQPALRDTVARSVRRYLSDVDGQPSEGLHALFLGEIELPLFREVLAYYDGNQSKAAAALGLNRATLRKKLQLHGLI